MSSLQRVLEKEGQSIAIVEDLLTNSHDWVNIQEIIRLSFRAVLETLRFQSTAISELERGLTNKPSKGEFNAMLTTRSIDNAEHISRVKDELSAMATALEGKLKDKLSKGEAELIVSRGYNEEFRLTDAKIRELQVDHEKLRRNVDNLADDITKSLTKLDTMTVVEQLVAEVKLKATTKELEESLRFVEERIQTAISRKASKTDVDAAVARKADQSVLQRVMGALESKAEASMVDQIGAALGDKADRSEVGRILSELSDRLHRREAEALQERLTEIQRLLEQSHTDLALEADSRHRLIRDEISHTKSTMASFSEELSAKVDVSEVDKVFSLLKRKADVDHIKDLRSELNEAYQVLAQELESNRLTFDNSIKETRMSLGGLRHLEDGLTKLEDSMHKTLQDFDLVRRRDAEETSKLVKSQTSAVRANFLSSIQEVNAELKGLHEYISQVEQARPDYTYIEDFRQTLDKTLVLKADIHEVQLALSSAQRDVARTVAEVREEARSTRGQLEADMGRALEGKLSASEVGDKLSDKVDKKELLKLLSSRVSPRQASVDDLELLRTETVKGLNDIKGGVARAEFKEFSTAIGRGMEDLGKELLLKANIKDLFMLLDSKASKAYADVEDINETLKDLHSELDTKANLAELNEHVGEQNTLNQLFCSENCAGRWVWRSGNIRSGLVPWEAEAVNACPENFFWERDSTTIITLAPGLYEVTWGFYSKKKPSVELLVNSEPVLSTLVRKATSANSKVSGQTCIDFLTLPAKARIAVTVTSPTPCEGFLSLRKL
jgi:hypothetical protein